MLILALDTTTRTGSAAVLRGDTVLAVVDGDPSRTHGERLPAELDAVLGLAGVRLGDVELLAVARGPGAFTGLRIGLAAMQGVAMVTGRPVIGVSALDALAAAAFERLGVDEVRIGAWMDAARGEIFAAAYHAAGTPGAMPTLTALTDPEVDRPEAVWVRWTDLLRPPTLLHPPAPDRTDPHRSAPVSTLIGDGAIRYAAVAGAIPIVPSPALAPFVGRLGWRAAGQGPHPPHDLQPLYVRRPDAERGHGP